MNSRTSSAKSDRLAAIIEFGRHHRATGDIDPSYPVLRGLMADLGLGTDDSLWLLALYVACYHLPVAVAAFLAHPEPGPVGPLPCGTERRGHRSPQALAAHLAAYLRLTQAGQAAYWCDGLGPDPAANFRLLYGRALACHGNGRWAAFKWVDLLLHTGAVAAPIAFPSAFLEESSGPRSGLAEVYPAARTGRLGVWAGLLRREFAAAGEPVPWDELETILCDFHSLCHGRYYVGHDIDEMLGRIHTTNLPKEAQRSLYAARAAAFPPAYLGELGGWSGVDKERNRAYRDTGAILLRP